jgi:hypothetical protein
LAIGVIKFGRFDMKISKGIAKREKNEMKEKKGKRRTA